VTEDARFEVWGSPRADDPRAALWPEVALLVPLSSDLGQVEDMLAVKPIVIPRVPVPGEQVEIAGRWANVEKVRWERHMLPVVRTQALPTTHPGLIERLESQGFTVMPRDDADDWLARLTGR
jgi:hypothetical protein